MEHQLDYGSIKGHLFNLFGPSEEHEMRICQPSQLPRTLGEQNRFNLSEAIVKSFWKQRLPQSIPAILSTGDDSTDKLTDIPDKIVNIWVNGMASVSSFSQSLSDPLVTGVEGLKGYVEERTWVASS